MKAQIVNTKQIDHKKTGIIARNKRVRVGLSLRAVARKMKVSPAFLSDLERGRRNWTEEKVVDFSRAIGE